MGVVLFFAFNEKKKLFHLKPNIKFLFFNKIILLTFFC